MPVADALALARGGRIVGGQSALALLLCEDRLRQNGYLGADGAWRGRCADEVAAMAGGGALAGGVRFIAPRHAADEGRRIARVPIAPAPIR